MTVTLHKTDTPLTLRVTDLRAGMQVTGLEHPGVWRIEWVSEYRDGDGRPRLMLCLSNDRTEAAWDHTVELDARIQVPTLQQIRDHSPLHP